MDLPVIGRVLGLGVLMMGWFCLYSAGTGMVDDLRVIKKGRFAGGPTLKILIRECEGGVEERGE